MHWPQGPQSVDPTRPLPPRPGDREERVRATGGAGLRRPPARRDRPGRGLPGGVEVYAGGGPPIGVDFLDLTYGAFPWLVARRAAADVRAAPARLPLAAPAAEGDRPEPALDRRRLRARSSCSSSGAPASAFGLISFDQIEGWIPVFLFAMLFGLSMDYEVFLVSRMREEWDDGAGRTSAAVAVGLAKTGRIVTAAGLIMFAAFMGFVAGSIVGLQQFGFGLADGDPRRRHDRPRAARAERDGALRPLELVAAGRRRPGRPRQALAARRRRPDSPRRARPGARLSPRAAGGRRGRHHRARGRCDRERREQPALDGRRASPARSSGPAGTRSSARRSRRGRSRSATPSPRAPGSLPARARHPRRRHGPGPPHRRRARRATTRRAASRSPTSSARARSRCRRSAPASAASRSTSARAIMVGVARAYEPPALERVVFAVFGDEARRRSSAALGGQPSWRPAASPQGLDLRRRRGDASPGADARHEQAPAPGRALADGLLPAPAAAARRHPRGAHRHRPGPRGRLHRPARRRPRRGARRRAAASSTST